MSCSQRFFREISLDLVSMFRDTADLEIHRWSQWKMKIPYWLPVVNTGLAVVILAIS